MRRLRGARRLNVRIQISDAGRLGDRRYRMLLTFALFNLTAYGCLRHQCIAADHRARGHRLETLFGGALEAGIVDAAIDDKIVDRGVVGRISGLRDEAAVTALRNGIIVEMAVTEMTLADKDPERLELVVAETRSVPIAIAVLIVVIAAIDAVTVIIVVGRHREPADIAAARTPHDPRRSPDVAGNPEPTITRIVDPTAVMVSDVAPTFVGDPEPAIFAGVHPIAIVIGPEIATDAGGMPDIAPTGVMAPGSIGREPAMEIVEADADSDLGARGNRDGYREESWKGDYSRAKRRCGNAKHCNVSLRSKCDPAANAVSRVSLFSYPEATVGDGG